MARFHSLTVVDVKKTTRDAVVLTLQPDAPETFEFIQGQYLTLRKNFGGEVLRRSYSICSGLDDGVLQVGIKRVEGGAFSTWLNDDIRIGDILESMPPVGSFYTPLDANAVRHYIGFAAGSGITPILSILRTILVHEPYSKFTLVYANRTVSSIMFREELEDLKNLYIGRLNVIHILKQDAQDIDLFTGRIDAEKCKLLFQHWIQIARVTTAFICGPKPMMLTIVDSLKAHGLSEEQIKYELFGSDQKGKAKRRTVTAVNDGSEDLTEAVVTLGGERRTYKMPRSATLLDSAIGNDVDAPFACKAGVCSTCRAKLTEGEVEMAQNHALEDGEVERGFVLTCQSFPLTNRVAFSYDDH